MNPAQAEVVKQGFGIEQFLAALAEPAGQYVLDLGDLSQSTVSYVTGRGHRLYAEDVLTRLDEVFGPGDPAVTQDEPGRVRTFLEECLPFPPHQFDVVLAWDTLEFLTRPVLDPFIEQLYTVLRPGGVLLACFHAEARDGSVDASSYRIHDYRTLALRWKGRRPIAQVFQNRTIERMFERFQVVKFFLSRDLIREVIVRK